MEFDPEIMKAPAFMRSLGTSVIDELRARIHVQPRSKMRSCAAIRLSSSRWDAAPGA
jgi:hypothetical protein